MEQNVHTPEVYDYRQYDKVWQRVAPTLEPYPGMQSSESVGDAPASLAVREEEQLPGAVMNPCCMGSAAADMLGVLTGFVEEERSIRRQYLALSRQAPSWARLRLREMAAEAEHRAQRLMAVYYLITGNCWRPQVDYRMNGSGRWCPALRELYHTAACSGLNYARAAESTTDLCLRELLQALSAEAYCQANQLLVMLERSLSNR